MFRSWIIFTWVIIRCLQFAEGSNNFDSYIISVIFANQILKENATLYNLSAVFADTQRPIKAVLVRYTIQIPCNENCYSNCSMLVKKYSYNNSNCPEDYYCLKLNYIWGRFAQVAYDDIYRELDVCPFIVGGFKQQETNITFKLNSSARCNRQQNIDYDVREEVFPCGWCQERKDVLPTVSAYSPSFPIPPTFLHTRASTPLEEALQIITAQLQGYATIKQVIQPLTYPSELALGYASKYDPVDFHYIFFHILFYLSYIFINIVIGMLVYKYRNRIYNRVYDHVRKDCISFSLFWSSIITLLILFSNIIIISFIQGGFCITILQLSLLGISLFFGIAFHLPIAACRLKKKYGFFAVFPNYLCAKYSCLDLCTQLFVFFVLYTLPHVTIFLLYVSAVNFFYEPRSYLIVFVHLSSLSLILWIGNAIFIYLISPSLFKFCICREKMECRRIVFAICLFFALISTNYVITPFVGDYAYNQKPTATSILSLIPGIVLTLLGWYLSGDLLKLFDVFSINRPPAQTQEETETELEEVVTSNGYKLMQTETERQPSRLKKIRRLVRAVRSDSSLPTHETPPIRKRPQTVTAYYV